LGNDPLPILLSFSKYNYSIERVPPAKENQTNETLWKELVEKYRRRCLVGVMDNQTYSQLAKILPIKKAQAVSQHLVLHYRSHIPKVKLYITKL
jgi:hypothetical protein